MTKILSCCFNLLLKRSLPKIEIIGQNINLRLFSSFPNHTTDINSSSNSESVDNDYSNLINNSDDKQEEKKLLKVAIIGCPNAGKSTLINRLLGIEVCPVSKRVHTTRKTQDAIFLDQDTQIIFSDTPGLVNKKEISEFSFNDDFIVGPKNSIKNADIIGVIHDISNKIYRHKLDRKIINTLKIFHHKDCILLLNKVDVLKEKRKLLEALHILCEGKLDGKDIPLLKAPKKKKGERINVYAMLKKIKNKKENPNAELKNESTDEDENGTIENEDLSTDNSQGWPNFKEVFMISALEGEGIESLKEYFIKNAKPASWKYDENILTNHSPMDLAIETLKAKMLEYLPHDVPYNVKCKLEYWNTKDDGLVHISISLKSPDLRHHKILMGREGVNIKKICLETEKTLSNILRAPVELLLNATFKEKITKRFNSGSGV